MKMQGLAGAKVRASGSCSTWKALGLIPSTATNKQKTQTSSLCLEPKQERERNIVLHTRIQVTANYPIKESFKHSNSKENSK
jgi:hypothetical protein